MPIRPATWALRSRWPMVRHACDGAEITWPVRRFSPVCGRFSAAAPSHCQNRVESRQCSSRCSCCFDSSQSLHSLQRIAVKPSQVSRISLLGNILTPTDQAPEPTKPCRLASHLLPGLSRLPFFAPLRDLSIIAPVSLSTHKSRPLIALYLRPSNPAVHCRCRLTIRFLEG